MVPLGYALSATPHVTVGMADRKIFDRNRIIAEMSPVGSVLQVERTSRMFGPLALQLSRPDGAPSGACRQPEEQREREQAQPHVNIS